MTPDFMAIVGPTGSGKTGLSLRIGGPLGAEIISMDSRQIYRGMDIGTGKVNLQERGLIPHHGLDIRNPDERYSAGQFARDARGWIQDIRARGNVPLLVGGTGFFLKALTHPMFREPELDLGRLERLRGFLNDLSQDHLEAFVAILDPDRSHVGREGRQRATRTAEVALLTGRPLSWWHRQSEPDQAPLTGFIVILDPPREALYEKIDERVGLMVEEGLAGEVEGLLAAGYREEDPGMTGAGYREMVRHLSGDLNLEEATDEIRRSHRRYARRQNTWFRHQLPPGCLNLGDLEVRDETAAQVLSAWAALQEEGLGPAGHIPSPFGLQRSNGGGYDRGA
jgi:tRNA dimethylallyltransferase